MSTNNLNRIDGAIVAIKVYPPDGEGRWIEKQESSSRKLSIKLLDVSDEKQYSEIFNELISRGYTHVGNDIFIIDCPDMRHLHSEQLFISKRFTVVPPIAATPTEQQ